MNKIALNRTCLAVAMILLSRTSQAACTIDWANVYQRIDGFGASCAFSQRTWSETTADIFFATNNSGTNICIGLSLLRNQIQPGGFATASELGLMRKAQARGVRVWSAPWTPQA